MASAVLMPVELSGLLFYNTCSLTPVWHFSLCLCQTDFCYFAVDRYHAGEVGTGLIVSGQEESLMTDRQRSCHECLKRRYRITDRTVEQRIDRIVKRGDFFEESYCSGFDCSHDADRLQRTACNRH